MAKGWHTCALLTAVAWAALVSLTLAQGPGCPYPAQFFLNAWVSTTQPSALSTFPTTTSSVTAGTKAYLNVVLPQIVDVSPGQSSYNVNNLVVQLANVQDQYSLLPAGYQPPGSQTFNGLRTIYQGVSYAVYSTSITLPTFTAATAPYYEGQYIFQVSIVLVVSLPSTGTSITFCGASGSTAPDKNPRVQILPVTASPPPPPPPPPTPPPPPALRLYSAANDKLLSTLTLAFQGQNYVLNSGGLLIIYRNSPPAGYKSYQLAELVKAAPGSTATTPCLEVFLTAPVDVRQPLTTIFPVHSVIGQWPNPPPVQTSAAAQIRVIYPANTNGPGPNTPPANTYSSGTVSQLTITDDPANTGQFTATGVIDAQGSSTSVKGSFIVAGMYK